MPDFSVHLAPEGFEAQLARELREAGSITAQRDRLFVSDVPLLQPAWAANSWLAPQWLEIDSIADAARKLKALQRNWALCAHGVPAGLHRRAALIQDKLPHVSARPIVFGQAAPTAPLGAWTLWDEKLLLASPACASPVADGQWNFVEDRVNPPGRAYLKLWETFTRLGARPQPRALCLDLGASPGGWSWVLASIGARVLAIDKAELDPRIARLPLVEHCRGSAFGLEPALAGEVDWLFSDVICYPARLLEYVRRWIDAGAARNVVCTLKFQGETDFEAMRGFLQLGGRLMHLSCNKHELTWVRLEAES